MSRSLDQLRARARKHRRRRGAAPGQRELARGAALRVAKERERGDSNRWPPRSPTMSRSARPSDAQRATSTAPCRKLSRAARGLSRLKTRSSDFFVEAPLRAPCSTASKPNTAGARRPGRQLGGDTVGDERAHRAAGAVVMDDQRPPRRRHRAALRDCQRETDLFGPHGRGHASGLRDAAALRGRLVGRRARLIDRHRELAVYLAEGRRRRPGRRRAAVPSSQGDVTPAPHSVSDVSTGAGCDATLVARRRMCAGASCTRNTAAARGARARRRPCSSSSRATAGRCPRAFPSAASAAPAGRVAAMTAVKSASAAGGAPVSDLRPVVTNAA